MSQLFKITFLQQFYNQLIFKTLLYTIIIMDMVSQRLLRFKLPADIKKPQTYLTAA